MNIPMKRIEVLDTQVSAGLENLEKKPPVKEILFANGYGPEDLDDLKNMQAKLREYYTEKESKNRTKISLTAQITALKRKLSAHYAITGRALKRALENDDILRSDLGLRHPAKRRTAVLLETARDFYTKAGDDSVIEKVTGYGVNVESLLAGIKLIDDIEALQKERHHLRSEKEAITALRNTTYRELNKKWRSLADNLKCLFKDEPHMVEGIIDVPSHGFEIRRKKKEEVEDPGTDEPAPEEPVSVASVSKETGVDNMPATA